MKEQIISIQRQLFIASFFKCLCIGFGIAVLGFGLSKSLTFSICLGLLSFGLSSFYFNLWANKKSLAIALIHQNMEESEYALDLIDIDKPSVVQQLQLERLASQWKNRSLARVIYKNCEYYALISILALVLVGLIPSINSKSYIESKSIITHKKETKQNVIPKLQVSALQITPPEYTQLKAFKSDELSIKAPEGSLLHWKIKFSDDENLRVCLTNQKWQELFFEKKKDFFEYSDRLISSGLYGIKAYLKDSLVYQSEFYTLEAQLDLAPKIEPSSKELYRLHFLKDSKKLQISAQISDDYLVKEVAIVATLARGSGENVKFREMRFPVEQKNFKSKNIEKIIDLNALQFTPGDELYYYWAATDNKVPQANFVKSDTYFLVYKDTSDVNEGELATMAVNILPEYFRSQRQIIIDTEKLISQKTRHKNFLSASNEIGFEQKALRIRYGQYLGEEYESSIGGGHGDEENLLDGFMHKHDSEEEHHEHHHHAEHSHQHQADEQPEDPLAALLADYVHSHDDAETNTFYEQSTRSLLKTALENMWQSELHLRLGEPEKALPYQNKALTFLKEAQHKARTFMAKSSYDPPPIKVNESRMKGDLKKFNLQYVSKITLTEEQIQLSVSEVLGYIEKGKKLSASQKLKVMVLSNSLNKKAVGAGLNYWGVLTGLRKLISDQQLSKEEISNLKKGLVSLIDRPKQSLSNERISNKKLQQTYWELL